MACLIVLGRQRLGNSPLCALHSGLSENLVVLTRANNYFEVLSPPLPNPPRSDPKSPQRLPRGSQDAPKSPKRHPRGPSSAEGTPKRRPRGAQEVPKRRKRCPRGAQEAPKSCRRAPKRRPSGAQDGQDASKRRPNPPKMESRELPKQEVGSFRIFLGDRAPHALFCKRYFIVLKIFQDLFDRVDR